MKPFFLLVLFFSMFYAGSVYAQAPQGMNYQAVVRDSLGNIVANKTIGIEFNIRQGSANGTIVYSETQSPKTDQFGTIALVIGQGAVVSGTFSSINWAGGVYFNEVLVDATGGTNYTAISSSQLLSVPYALYAQSAGNFSANGSVPTITTAVDSVHGTYANALGNVTSDGGQIILARGFCYNTSPNPTTENNVIESNGLLGNFTISLNLNPATTYYVRAFATNINGTAYGNEVIFTTPADSTFTFNMPLSYTATYGSQTGGAGTVFATAIQTSKLDSFINSYGKQISDLQTISLFSATVVLDSPVNHYFNEFNSFQMYMKDNSGDSMKIAYVTPIPTNTDTLVFSSQYTDMSTYFEASTFYLDLLGLWGNGGSVITLPKETVTVNVIVTVTLEAN